MAKIKPFPENHHLGARPWQRQRGESESQYTWFRRYLNMRLPRSIRALAEQHQASADHLYAISAARRWAERAWAWEMAEQTQHDREVMLRHRRRHAQLTEAVSHLTARCLAHAHSQVELMAPDKAVARAFDGARTVHQMTASSGPAVTLNTTVSTSAQAATGVDLERHDAARGRDRELEERLLAQIQADARYQVTREIRPHPGAAEDDSGDTAT